MAEPTYFNVELSGITERDRQGRGALWETYTDRLVPNLSPKEFHVCDE